MRTMLWLLCAVWMSACQITFHSDFYTSDSRNESQTPQITPPTMTPVRISRTPWPTQAPTQPRDLPDYAVIAAIEHHTMRIYTESAPAVVAIEAAFRHPPIDGVDLPDELFVSQGSGFLYDDQGHIVTNAHVVASADTYRIRIDEQRVISATVIGRDSTHDLAVLLLDEYIDIAPLTLSQRPAQPGMWIMAIGNPFGLRDSVSVGIVSGIARELSGQYGMMNNIIQIDTSVNPGSSGGVILDSEGAVLGLVTAIQSGNGSFAGIGYAIPISTIQTIVPTLIAGR